MNNVKDLDLHLYAGKWFEIAKLPNPWQKQCYRSETSYYVDDRDISKGKLPQYDIVNVCFDENGNVIKTNNARARVANRRNKGVLKAKWEGLGEEQVMVVYDTDYINYSLEGDKDKKYMWILSRARNICENVIENLVVTAMSFGFDVESLEIVPNSVAPCPFQSEDLPRDQDDSFSPDIREKLKAGSELGAELGDITILKPAEFGADLLIPKYSKYVKSGFDIGRKINQQLIDTIYKKRL